MKLSNLPNYKNVGPGSYYHTHLNTLKPNMYLFYRRENPDTYIPNKINKEKEKAIVGPGKYMIKSQFDVEKAEYSGPCQRRFNYSLKEENILHGKDMINAYAKSKGINFADINKPEYQEKIIRKYGFHDWNS